MQTKVPQFSQFLMPGMKLSGKAPATKIQKIAFCNSVSKLCGVQENIFQENLITYTFSLGQKTEVSLLV